MAHCLRGFSPRLPLTSIFGSFRLAYETPAPRFGQEACGPEQYSTQFKPKNREIDTVYDNRELVNDVVRRISVIHFQNAESPKPEQVLFSDKDSDPQKLSRVLETLSEDIPRLFTRTMNYSIYHPEVVFENNIRGLTTVGLYNYVKQISLLRTVGHFKYAFVTMQVLKITKHSEDSTIKVRWRISGVTAFRILSAFWKFKFWRIREITKNDSHHVWFDGFSTFYVNSEGKIYKHVADKMMPDSEHESTRISPMRAAKIALLTAVLPRVPDFFTIT